MTKNYNWLLNNYKIEQWEEYYFPVTYFTKLAKLSFKKTGSQI